MNFKDLNLGLDSKTVEVKLSDTTTLNVRTYLPLAEKTALIEYVVNNALDENTGCFSPIRTETFFKLAIAHYYAGIDFEDDLNAASTYDILETNGVFAEVMSAIGDYEIESLMDLVNDTTEDIARYNNSFAGIVRIASTEATGLDNQLDELVAKIRDGSGTEFLNEIKGMVGKG